ncbi:MAG: bifunctional diguanylate cyclase/phosphodiesterase, partial [Rhodospirillales bacterium]|nr:bifunctional diguanylate cyclase/phosphodiesterase [Rhodospirillales bacterium]
VAVADRIQATLAEWADRLGGMENCTATRFGGDEFVVLIRGQKSLDQIRPFAEDLLRVLRQSYKLRGHEVFTSASAGITTSDINYTGSDQVLRDSDAAMYRAKADGKDCLFIFNRSVHEQTLHRLELETDLRKALKREEFYLVYQPIVDIEDGRLEGFEALLRWRHPRRVEVMPSEFIPVAEETGLILSIGQWVLQTAVEQLRVWQRRFESYRHLTMSVNLSKRQTLDPSLLQNIQRVIEETQIDPDRLKMEITESVVMDRPEVVAPILKRVKELGVGLAMDDFGAGHSSLNCLHRFPIDILKIDRMFICNLSRSFEYAAVIQAIVTLAGNLGMSVTAEGIETTDQLAQIQALECTHGQGRLFAKPLDADSATNWLGNGMQFAKVA